MVVALRTVESIGDRPLPTRAASVLPSQVLQGAALDQFNAAVAAGRPPEVGGMFDFLGDVLKVAAPVAGGIGGFLLGGPAGAMAGASLGGALSKTLSGDVGGALSSVANTALQQTGFGQTLQQTGLVNVGAKLLSGDIGGAASAATAAAVRQLTPPGGPNMLSLSSVFGGGSIFGGGPPVPPPNTTLGDLQAAASDLFSGNFLGALQAGGAAVTNLLAPSRAASPPAMVGPPNPFLNPPPIPTTIPFKEPNMGTVISLGGPMGINFSSGGSGSAAFTPPQGYTAGNIQTVGQFRSMLLKTASQKAGFHVTWKKLLFLLMHYGLAIVKQLTGLDETTILWLQMNRPHKGRRGPYLRTIEKRVRQAAHYKKRVAHVAHELGLHTRASGQTVTVPHRRKSARR